MWYTSLSVAHKWLSELGNSDSILDMICSSTSRLKVKIHTFFKCIYYRAYSMAGIPH